MQTERNSRTTTISLPPALYRETLAMARMKGMTRSELVRDALRRYQREETEWNTLLEYGKKRASTAGIRNEADIEKMVDAVRK